MTQSKFLTFVGIDYCGKTTQLKRLEPYLKEKEVPAVFVREPGSTVYGVGMRQFLLRPDEAFGALKERLSAFPEFAGVPETYERTSITELLMFLTARAEFVDKIVVPPLKEGTSVVSDRFGDCTRAYQGGGRFLHDKGKIDLINSLNREVCQGIWPNRTYWLDIPVDEMLERAEKDTNRGRLDFIEKSGPEFFERAREEYATIAKEEPDRVLVIDGMQPIQDIEGIIQADINQLYGL